jgi:hypothetical protein
MGRIVVVAEIERSWAGLTGHLFAFMVHGHTGGDHVLMELLRPALLFLVAPIFLWCCLLILLCFGTVSMSLWCCLDGLLVGTIPQKVVFITLVWPFSCTDFQEIISFPIHFGAWCHFGRRAGEEQYPHGMYGHSRVVLPELTLLQNLVLCRIRHISIQ